MVEMNSLLDPFILAVPAAITVEAECLRYAQTLENWSGSVNESLHKILLSYPLINALIDVDQYPLESNLRKLRSLQPVINSFDTFRSCERQLTSPPFIEDHI